MLWTNLIFVLIRILEMDTISSVVPLTVTSVCCVSGTLGVAVTYCCYGEEENKMMAIAQKCSLNLTHLPGTSESQRLFQVLCQLNSIDSICGIMVKK